MKKEMLNVGVEVFLKPIGNAARYNKGVVETKITKVARKYFHVENFSGVFSNTKFEIESGCDYCGDYSSNWKAYLSKKELIDEKIISELHKIIRSEFSGYRNTKLSLEQLERINDIIKEG